jgi:hypothetical protein
MDNDEIRTKLMQTKEWKGIFVSSPLANILMNKARADERAKLLDSEEVERVKKAEKLGEKKQKQKDIEKLEKAMPYPEDVFIPRSKAEIKRVVELIKKNNLSPDAIFAEYMRISWRNAIAKLKED